MCVIALVEENDKRMRPTEEMVRKMYQRNHYGGGIAYREENKEGRVAVKWKKGLDLDEMLDANRRLPFPYVLHFRIPSTGTPLRSGMCHPFPLDPRVQLDLSGTTLNGVLFHNGYWTSWKHTVQDAAIKSGKKIPTDSWSDSRGLAWMAHNFGLGILELIDEKVVAFGPDFVEVYGNGWEKVDGVWVSNKLWTSEVLKDEKKPEPKQITDGKARTGGSSHTAPFRLVECFGGRTGGKEDKQEPVQEAKEGTDARVGKEDEERDWAVNINQYPHKGKKKPLWDSRTLCQECSKNEARIFDATTAICWPCHEALRNRRSQQDAPKKYMCEYCHVKEGIALTVDYSNWICTDCWHLNGKPEVYEEDLESAGMVKAIINGAPVAEVDDEPKKNVDPEREKRRELAKKGITITGPM